ncbi:ATP-binding protein, partial [Persicitalea sp.]|uniref:ATP-binding protein n=1 Tax=Persicitalea sp. TaxID=3100273 RepID=UPI0035934DCB
IATVDGLSIINTREQTITNVGEEQGMVPDELFEIQEKKGVIYLGSKNGLIQMKPGKNHKWSFYNLNESQGFPENNYNTGGAHVMKNGQLWMSAGYSTYKLNILTQAPSIDTLPCPVAITGLKIADEYQSFSNRADLLSFFETNDTLWYNDGKQFYLEQTIPQDSGYLFTNNIRWDSLSLPYKMPVGLKLPYDQNSLQFRYSNLCVFNWDKISSRYTLEGKDDAWVEANDASTSKTYFNLPAGKYTFKVATRGVTGKWGAPAEFSFTILPPWWQTWWAYLLYAIMAIGTVVLIVRLRSKQLKEENRLLEEKVTKRTTELKVSLDHLKATQSQLIQSEKMASLGELTAGIAHEIQNPLNFVNNYSEVNEELIDEISDVLTQGDLDEVKLLLTDLKDNQTKIQHHGKRADAIVRGMLQHSRTSSGTKEPTNLNALADEYLRLAYHGLRAKDSEFQADFETDFDNNLPLVDVVAQDIGRVLLNIINNAFQAVNERRLLGIEEYQPAVKVATKKLEDLVEISIVDNGIGIPEAIRDKIFQPFFTTKPTGQGTGLGLSLAYDIVKAQAGDLEVESMNGEGSTFILKLPMQSN